MTNAQAIRLIRAIREHSDLELSSIRDAASHGADAGYGGFTYYTDTTAFVAANRTLIWEILSQDADEFGYDNIPAFIASWTLAYTADDEIGFDNLIAWYALEAAGRWLLDRREEVA